jgi:PleD family two-component response regulator
MRAYVPRRRVLVAAGASAVFSLRDLFAREPLDQFEPVEADSLARARFVMQHHPCDIMLMHEDVYHRAGDQGLAWLRQGRDVPLVFLAAEKPQTFSMAYREGADMCLSRDMALHCPELLAAALERAANMSDLRRGQRHAQQQLVQCRRHVDRLVNLIWRATPVDADNQWCTQRHTMERLQEEVARTQRHGGPFTLAVGELQAEDDAPQDEVVSAWMADAIAKAKRRCDVAGQYGMRGFMLLMVLTPKSGGMICCRRLQRILQGDEAKGARGPLRAAFGLASSTSESCTPEILLRIADQNLEMAKAGKNDGVVAE